MRGELVSAPSRDAPERLLESAVLEWLHLAAVATDEVVMMMIPARVDALEARDPISQIDALHEAELAETLERSIDARDSDPRSLRAEAFVDLLGGEAAALAAKQLDDHAAGAAAAAALGAHPVEHVLGPSFGHRR